MIGVGLIGTGQIALQNHVPGLRLCAQARLAGLCDANPSVLQSASRATGVSAVFLDYRQMLERDDIHAVIVATPNHTHARIVMDAAARGKHVLCEKPLALSLDEAVAMWNACRGATVRHMTAFTYRFVPAMRWMARRISNGDIGRPWHFRAQRFQDWADRPLGWRQRRDLAGSGELGDMLSHRIDFGHLLIGPIRRLVADTQRIFDQRGGAPSDLEDWVAMLARFESGATGVFESAKTATGCGESWRSHDHCEVNGESGTLVYRMQNPNEIFEGRTGASELRAVQVPREMLVWPGSHRDPADGDPRIAFRYDQAAEFINAVLEQRPCVPSLLEGVRVQAVMQSALRSAERGAWVDVPSIDDEERT